MKKIILVSLSAILIFNNIFAQERKKINLNQPKQEVEKFYFSTLDDKSKAIPFNQKIENSLNFGNINLDSSKAVKFGEVSKIEEEPKLIADEKPKPKQEEVKKLSRTEPRVEKNNPNNEIENLARETLAFQEEDEEEKKNEEEEIDERELEKLRGKKIVSFEILGIKDKTQLNNAEVALSLSQVLKENIEQVDYVYFLIENGKNEIAQSQQPFGYYDVKVEVDKKINNDEIKVIYKVDLQKPVKLNTISVEVSGEAKNDPEFQKILARNPFKKGQTLSHTQYEEYKSAFLEAAVVRGYFEGKFSAKVIEVIPEDYVANISLHYESGERFKFGNVRFRNRTEGADKDTPLPLREDLLQRFVQFSAGADYSSLEVEKLQQDLQASGYFKQVIAGGRPKKEDKTVPVGVFLAMNKRDHYAIGAGYSTDSGFRGKFNFDRRWVNDRGHSFNSSLYVSQKNSDFDNLYRIPAKNPTTDYYYLRTGGNIKNDDYDSRRYFFEGGYNWRKDKWDYRVSGTTAWEKFSIGNDHDEVWLTYPTLQAVYTDAENRLNPDKGFQAKLNVLGAAKNLGSDISFVQSNAGLRYIYSLNPKNRFSMRFDGGATWTDEFHRLPPTLRYLTGGDRTVRGYSFEKIGEYDSSGTNIGGKYLAVGALEYEYYFSPNWAAALFVDAGDSFSHKFDAKIGAGAGLHWKSPVGPIKIDFAHGFDEELGSKFRLHLNVGAELNL